MDNRKSENTRKESNLFLYNFRYYYQDAQGNRDYSKGQYRVNVIGTSQRDAIQWVEHRNKNKIEVCETGNNIEIHSITGNVVRDIVRHNRAWVAEEEKRAPEEEKKRQEDFAKRGKLGTFIGGQ